MANVYVRDFKTRSIVDTIPTNKTGSALEKMLVGLMRNMDLDRFFVDDSECDENGESSNDT
jgi:hypothetical protein